MLSKSDKSENPALIKFPIIANKINTKTNN